MKFVLYHISNEKLTEYWWFIHDLYDVDSWVNIKKHNRRKECKLGVVNVNVGHLWQISYERNGLKLQVFIGNGGQVFLNWIKHSLNNKSHTNWSPDRFV